MQSGETENSIMQFFRNNSYGTIMSDITTPYYWRTRRYQYEHPKACAQPAVNIMQTNVRDIHLPNITLTNVESELRNQTRPYSRLPSTRYQGNCSANSDYSTMFSNALGPKKQVGVCTNMPTISEECERKIVTNYYYDGPTKNY